MVASAPEVPRSASRRRPPARKLLPLWLRENLRAALNLVLDAAAVAGAYRLAYLWRFHNERWVAAFPIPGAIPDWTLYAKLLYAVVPLWLMILWYSARLYDAPWLSLADRLIRIVKGCFLAAAAVMVATYVYSRLEYSRMMLVLVFPLSVALVWASQALVLWLDSRLALLGGAPTTLLIGGGAVARELKERLLLRHPGAEVRELPGLPPAAELARLLAQDPCDELILFEPSLPHDRILETAELCDARGAAFKMLPDILELRLGEVQMDHSLGLPAYRIQHGSMTALNFSAKRAFDLAFCLLVLLAAGLPLLLAALLIKLDSPGAVLYRQERYGYKGRIFRMYKFRTMTADAEARFDTVQGLNSHGGAFFKAKEDPRVTRAGRWLRRLSLDELPQFINVLQGEMSVVGPRPLPPSSGELEKLVADFGPTAKKRMNMLPGITGLWQVSGRSDVSSAQRFALDMFYIEHWSLGLDLEIILKTIPAMLTAKGAY